MGEVPGPYVAAALVPAVIIAVLFYFDHNVSSQMAQQPEFNLVKGPAYHWDFLLLSGLVGVAVWGGGVMGAGGGLGPGLRRGLEGGSEGGSEGCFKGACKKFEGCRGCWCVLEGHALG